MSLESPTRTPGRPLLPRASRWLEVCCIAGVASVLAGCARYQTFDLPDEPAHMRQNYQDRNGLTVAARLLVDPVTLEYYYGRELSGAGYFSVIVQIENREEGSFELEREDFVVVLENGDRFVPVRPLDVLAGIRRSPLNLTSVLLSPLIFPPVLVYTNTRDYNFEMARSFQKKAFPAALRLESGDAPLTRALFFRDPRDPPRPDAEFDSSVLQFLVEEEGSPTSQEAPGDASGAGQRVVGRRLTFTISLTREGL